MAIDEKIAEKIKKLLALSNSSNENEAENAMLKAQELLLKYNLTIDSVNSATKEEEKEVVKNFANAEYVNMAWHDPCIANIIADNFRCYLVMYKSNKKSKLSFVGIKEDVDIAIEVYNFAKIYFDAKLKAFKKACRDRFQLATTSELTGKANDYIRGFIGGLEAKFKEQVDRNNWGLILVKDDAVIDYYENMNLKKGRSGSIKSNHDAESFGKGFQHGKEFTPASGMLN